MSIQCASIKLMESILDENEQFHENLLRLYT